MPVILLSPALLLTLLAALLAPKKAVDIENEGLNVSWRIVSGEPSPDVIFKGTTRKGLTMGSFND